MKKFISFVLVLIVLLSGCAQSYEDVKEDLIGEWVLIQEEGKAYPHNYRVIFNSDGTARVTVGEYASKGTYTIDDRTVTITYSEHMGATYEYAYSNGKLILWDSGNQMKKNK